MSRVLPRVLVSVALGAALIAGVTAIQGPAAGADPKLDGEPAAPTMGSPIPGEALTADSGQWSPESPERLSFAWHRDGVPIPGAQTQVYTVQPADVGHQVVPVVTGERAGYAPDTFTGSPLLVRRLTSTTSLDVRRAQPPGKRRLVWTAFANLRTERPWATDGTTMTIFKATDTGTKVLAQGPVVRGIAYIKLPWRRVPQGISRLTACYAATDAVDASCSSVVRVRRPGR